MANEKIVTYTEFQNNPELRAKFEGNYESYLNSFSAKLLSSGLFKFAAQNSEYSSIPGLNQVSLFFGAPKSVTNQSPVQVQEQDDKKQNEIDKKLEQIKDPKIRAQVEAEVYTGNLSDAFLDMLIDRYEKKKDEFDEIWAKYQLAKGEAADMKKTCERLLREYRNNESSSIRSQYITAERQYTDADMWSDIYLSEAMDVSHRVVG